MNDTGIQAIPLGDVTSAETSQRNIFIFSAIIQPPIYLFGFIANLINIFVYLKIGLKDCINICFFVLSCSDLASVMMLILEEITHMLTDIFQEIYHVRGKDLSFLFVFYYGAFYDISQGITTFIAVQKCWCVALPFRFKNTFTTSRTSVILSGISVTIFSMHLPILSSQGMQETMTTDTNTTVLLLWTAEIRKQVFPIVGLMSLIFTNTCQFTVIFCLIVLASSLRASSKFRNSSNINTMDLPNTDFKSDNSKANDKNLKRHWMTHNMSSKKKSPRFHCNASEKQVDEKSSPCYKITPAPRRVKATSRKELQAIKSTTFVSILFVTCNTFKLLNYYVILCIPDFSLYGRFKNTYFLTNYYRIFLESLHISCNVFVYLKFNSRFRSTLLTSCGNGYLQACICRFKFN